MDWDVVWGALFVAVVVLPILAMWTFALVDLFGRSDLRPMAKVGWLLGIIIFPVLGTVVYFLVRPQFPTAQTPEYEQAQAAFVADKLTELTALREKGVISAEDYERQKARLVSA